TTGRLTNKDLAKLFEDQATYATGSEKFTETFIKAASTVWERLLTPPGPRAVLMALDDAYGLANPLNSVYVMEAFAQKTKNGVMLLWTLHGVQDCLDCTLTTPGELNNRALTGKNAGGKGLIDLLMFKKECGDFLIQWMERNRIDKVTSPTLKASD
ncbi:unnamed protein product, partial [Prorocentrum cordatum]